MSMNMHSYNKFKTFCIRKKGFFIQTFLFTLLCIASVPESVLVENLPSWLASVLGAGEKSSLDLRLGGAAAVATIAAAAISAGGAAYGASQNKKAGDASSRNQQAYNKAIQAKEKEARKLYDDFVKKWEKKKKELGEDFSLAQFV